jgi:hypothetical protein
MLKAMTETKCSDFYPRIVEYLNSLGYSFVDFGSFAKSDASMMISVAHSSDGSTVGLWLTDSEFDHQSGHVSAANFQQAKALIDLMDFAVDQELEAGCNA